MEYRLEIIVDSLPQLSIFPIDTEEYVFLYSYHV